MDASPSSSVLMESSKVVPAVVMRDATGSILRTPTLDYDGNEGIAILRGASQGDLVIKNESTTKPSPAPTDAQCNTAPAYSYVYMDAVSHTFKAYDPAAPPPAASIATTTTDQGTAVPQRQGGPAQLGRLLDRGRGGQGPLFGGPRPEGPLYRCALPRTRRLEWEGH